jgi:hypothetical protein
MSTVSPVKRSPPGNVDDLLMRDVVAATNRSVTRSSLAARSREEGRPDIATYIHEMAQQIAGVTLACSLATG